MVWHLDVGLSFPKSVVSLLVGVLIPSQVEDYFQSLGGKCVECVHILHLNHLFKVFKCGNKHIHLFLVCLIIKSRRMNPLKGFIFLVFKLIFF